MHLCGPSVAQYTPEEQRHAEVQSWHEHRASFESVLECLQVTKGSGWITCHFPFFSSFFQRLKQIMSQCDSVSWHSDSFHVQVMQERFVLTSVKRVLFTQTSGIRRQAQWQIWRRVDQTFECLHTVMTEGRKYETECQITVEAPVSCSEGKIKKHFCNSVRHWTKIHTLSCNLIILFRLLPVYTVSSAGSLSVHEQCVL